MVVSLLCAAGCTAPSLAPRGDLGAPGPERPPAALLKHRMCLANGTLQAVNEAGS